MYFESLFKDRHSLWSLLVFEDIYFWRPLSFECLILGSRQEILILSNFVNFITIKGKKTNKISEKKNMIISEEKNRSATIMISVDGTGTVFPLKL